MTVKMLHTCIRVKDLDKSLEFYKNAFEFIETRRKDYKEHGFTLVYVSNEVGGYEIELTYNYDTRKSYDLGNGFSHIAVGVEKLEETREKHIKLGYDVTELKGFGEKPNYYFVTDPDGYRIEVIRIS